MSTRNHDSGENMQHLDTNHSKETILSFEFYKKLNAVVNKMIIISPMHQYYTWCSKTHSIQLAHVSVATVYKSKWKNNRRQFASTETALLWNIMQRPTQIGQSYIIQFCNWQDWFCLWTLHAFGQSELDFAKKSKRYQKPFTPDTPFINRLFKCQEKIMHYIFSFYFHCNFTHDSGLVPAAVQCFC